jgi:hypothetical protein
LEQKPISAAAVQPALDRVALFFRTQVSQPAHGKLVHWESEPLQDSWSAAGQPASGGGGGGGGPHVGLRKWLLPLATVVGVPDDGSAATAVLLQAASSAAAAQRHRPIDGRRER